MNTLSENEKIEKMIKEYIPLYVDYHCEMIEELNLKPYVNREIEEGTGRIISVSISLVDSSDRWIDGYDEWIYEEGQEIIMKKYTCEICKKETSNIFRFKNTKIKSYLNEDICADCLIELLNKKGIENE